MKKRPCSEINAFKNSHAGRNHLNEEFTPLLPTRVVT
jgi:hypothetical protein